MDITPWLVGHSVPLVEMLDGREARRDQAAPSAVRGSARTGVFYIEYGRACEGTPPVGGDVSCRYAGDPQPSGIGAAGCSAGGDADAVLGLGGIFPDKTLTVEW